MNHNNPIMCFTDARVSNGLHCITGAKCTSGEEVSVYVDLAYIPSGPSSPTVGVDFFRCVRSSCYVVSGDSQEKEEIMRRTLDALLDAKTSWPDSMQVSKHTHSLNMDVGA